MEEQTFQVIVFLINGIIALGIFAVRAEIKHLDTLLNVHIKHIKSTNYSLEHRIDTLERKKFKSE